MTFALPDHIVRMRLTGRADDSQFAQNPEPVVISMAATLAAMHGGPVEGLEARTPRELDAANALVRSGSALPAPFEQVDRSIVADQLASGVWQNRPPVATHGAPVVQSCSLADSVAVFDDLGVRGADPAERDLAIALRSIAETFGAEATRWFLETYEEADGSSYDLAVLDWYGLVAAFR